MYYFCSLSLYKFLQKIIHAKLRKIYTSHLLGLGSWLLLFPFRWGTEAKVDFGEEAAVGSPLETGINEVCFFVRVELVKKLIDRFLFHKTIDD